MHSLLYSKSVCSFLNLGEHRITSLRDILSRIDPSSVGSPSWGGELKKIGGGVATLFLVLFFLFLGRAKADSSSPDCSQDEQKTKAICRKKDIEPRTEETVVTGTFTPVPATEIDRSVSVIDTRENSVLYGHWTGYLQLDSSTDLQQRAPDGVQADLSIRGSGEGQTLILLNGLRMDDVQSDHHDLDLPVPTESIERIEILRGAGSTFYGSDAVSGAINVITGPPTHSEVRVGGAVGNFGVNQESLSASFLTANLDEQLSLARDFSSGFLPDRDYRSLTIFSHSGAQTVLGRTLVMLGYGDKPFGADQFYGPYPSWERTKSWFAGLRQDLGSKTEFDLGYRRHSDEFVLFRNDPSIYENNHIDESWQASLRGKDSLGQHSTLFYGGEAFYESIASNNLGQHNRTHGAVYADYDVLALSHFSFSIGAREEVFDSHGGEFSPGLAAGIWFKAGWKLKGAASRAFRLPNYTDLYYSDPANIGNPNLLPETAWSYEGGLLWDRGGPYKAEVTVFDRREHNDIDYVRVSSTDPWQAENIGRLNFTGVETSLEVRLPRRQTLEFAYTALHGAQNALHGLQSKYVFNYPIDEGVISWQGALPGHFVARTRIGVTHRFDRDPYGIWDAAVGREFRNVAAHLGLSNLTSTQYQEIEGVVMPGRSLVFGLDFFMAKK
jgi:iron complex outermembrane recepter protein